MVSRCQGYVRACVARLADAPFQTIVDGVLPLPEPAAYAAREAPGRRGCDVETIGTKVRP